MSRFVRSFREMENRLTCLVPLPIGTEAFEEAVIDVSERLGNANGVSTRSKRCDLNCMAIADG